MAFNGKMITLARESRGVTQEALSKMVGEQQTTISAIENAKKEDDELVLKIANALNYPASFFMSDDSINRLSMFYYRKREAFPQKAVAALEAKMEIVRKAFTRLTKQVHIQYKGLPEMESTIDRTPEQIAEFTRLYFNLGNDPIDNPVGLLERIGIPILFFDVASDKFSGMTIQTDNNVPLIIINKNLPNDHKKFTLFHEVGHLIMHVPFTSELDFYDRYPNKDIIEKEADKFAAAFLMPATKAWQTFGRVTYAKLSDLKLYWKVSKQAILYRAKDLGIIDENKFKYIYIELSRNGERKKENISISIDEPTLLKRIIELHKEKLGYTEIDIANEIARISLDDFNDWFDNNNSIFKIIKNI